jgi:release factor glutamine methyltransferase
MTGRSLLAQGSQALAIPGRETPGLDALLLLAHALDLTKERLMAALPDPVDPAASERYRGLLERRRAGVPVSYLTGRKEFWGLDFVVDGRVLAPRPDTETLVERALETARGRPEIRRVLDLCAGSGCVGIAIASERPDLEVTLSDVSAEAIEVARANARRLLGAELPAVVADLFDGAPGPFDLVTANPPYLSDAETDRALGEGSAEPALALRGGAVGTELAARLIREAPAALREGGWLILEAGPGQFDALAAAMAEAGFADVAVARDLGGRERVAAGRLDRAGGRHA